MIKYLKSPQERTIKKYQKIVDKINSLEPEFERLSDSELRNKTDEFKNILANNGTIHDITAEAFAVVREAAKRVLGMRHYDVQLIGGLSLLEGNISEMPTGEGKTLVASLPSYLRALEGKGVHVITVNEYLAKRDKEINGKVHEFLGLTIGLNLAEMSPVEKQAAYEADITYGIGTEFGFDYLRDHMIMDVEQRVQRPYHFAIIDEVDSILIDEAKTPLIIAGKTSLNSELFKIVTQVIKRFKVDIDYNLDVETKAVSFTDEGITKIEKTFGIDNLYDLTHQTLYHYMIQSLRAEVVFRKDVDYIVKDGKIELIDMFTGRILEGRSLSDGLHQAIEAKEGLELTDENKMQASITIQNYFRMYPILSGMTGTAKSEEKEFQQIYGMDVIQIPTNKPKIREDMNDLVFETAAQKYTAMTNEVIKRYRKGQPILIGTTSIEQSEIVAEYLNKEKLPFQLLNAKSVEKEAELISNAGQKDQITIATNMAGRGTDIMLGDGVAELGGLHVIGTERHESRRIDNQLKGRAGRQGDPGSSQFFISIEDEIIRRFAPEQLEKFKKTIKTNDEGLILNKNILDFVDRVQKICEGSNYSAREYTLKLDDVVNEQRKIIYTLRNNLLENEDPFEYIQSTQQSIFDHYVEKYYHTDEKGKQNLPEFLSKVKEISIFDELEDEEIDFEEQEAIMELAKKLMMESKETFEKIYEDQPYFYFELNESILRILDRNWMQHLEYMSRLKEGIGLRGYGQEDPVITYQKEGLSIFSYTFYNMEEEVCQLAASYVRDYIAPEDEEIDEIEEIEDIEMFIDEDVE
ncbi:accessory Sec system translocase SecA2 [Bacillus sp. FJAT-49736]|uniref:accessory Sec system translocase SecA2 n=1 Tax=Bacillus sp. FJAT-49736 TaxID=2833582 RepID=UPI001BC91B01|nr:accessory Sec system translocase SecA2 [Bacillus sp. FJAT-49736]MBS4174182.1 accessory Sec system translocase SecA2 [Bacillus sp. FJAT-49736]